MDPTVCTSLRASAGDREQLLEAYGQYLSERDGDPDPAWQTLSRREDGMRRLRAQTVRYQGSIDQSTFEQAYFGTPPADLPRELALLLTFVKINSNEAFAVETLTRVKKNLLPIERRILTQENYHTRLLLGAADLYGVAVPGRIQPPAALRVVVGIVARTPPAIMHPLALASEILGVASFKRLLDATRTTLAGQPELRDALEERLLQVCTDEVGHMTYNRLKVGPWGMKLTRRLLPLLLLGFRDTLPEMDRLCGPLTLADLEGLRVQDLPAAARQHAFMA